MSISQDATWMLFETTTRNGQQISLSNEPAYDENLRGRPQFRVTKAQIESLREIGFSWTKIADLIGISRVTLYRRRRELEIGEQHNYSKITDIQLDAVIQSIVQNSPGDDERCASWAGIENSKKENKGVNVAG